MKYLISTFLLVSITTLSAQSSILGIWKAIDDKNNKPTSHIKIFEKNSKVYGKIIKLYDRPEDSVCELCSGEKKNTPIIGLEIIWDMKPKGKEYSGGNILDPEDGNTYKCKIALNSDGTLKVRGYIGIPALGRSQKWQRVE